MNYKDVKRIRENPTMDDVDNKELSKMIDAALEKQIPKKAIKLGYNPLKLICSISYICPNCNKHVSITPYCDNCGQALLWEREVDTE